MANQIEELEKDLKELLDLEKQAARRRLKSLFCEEKKKIEEEIEKLKKEHANNVSLPKVKENKNVQIQITNYAWDQDKKFVKFYITLKKVLENGESNVTCTFTNRSLQLSVINLEGKDYYLKINNLLHEINSEDSKWRLKTDMIIVSCKKKDEGVTWSHVTEYEKKASEASKMDFEEPDTSSDPGDGLMNIMKKMYDKGDDEMKRTIAKAWTESQQQKSKFKP